MTTRPSIPIVGETRIDHGEPRLTPEEQEAERRRTREAFQRETQVRAMVEAMKTEVRRQVDADTERWPMIGERDDEPGRIYLDGSLDLEGLACAALDALNEKGRPARS